jgi:transcriptional regulator of arginine metabolism
MKLRRQELILELVEREVLRSQEELRARLRRRGVEATQATISRDIRDLKLVKRAVDGAYQRMNGQPGRPAGGLETLGRLAAEFLSDVESVQQLVVLRTGAGQAQPLALAIDRAQLPEAVGTIAGDDTILLIARDARRAGSLAKRLKRLASGIALPDSPQTAGRRR